MLVPAGVLVLFLLGGIALDSALVLMAERDLANRVAAASNDIAAAGLSEHSFYLEGGAVALDQDRAGAYVAAAFAPDLAPSAYRSWTAQATTEGRRVTVEASAEVRHVFAQAIPGVRSTSTVSARATATATGG